MAWFRNPVAEELRRLSWWMRRPVAFNTSLIRREMKNMALVYSVTAAPAVDPDVIARRMTVTVNGEPLASYPDFAATATSFGEIEVPQNSHVVMTLVDVDDVGNVSEPAVVEFSATDTIPPAKPGEFGVTLMRETA